MSTWTDLGAIEIVAAGYAAAADRHRPTDHASLVAEIRRLGSDSGLKARDIAAALRLDLAYVLHALQGSEVA